MSIFAGRDEVLSLFYQLAQYESSEWLLLLDGVEGIGKTSIIRHLIQQNQDEVNRLFIPLNLISAELSHDPLIFLDQIAANLPKFAFTKYSNHLLKAYNRLQNAHITAENILTVEKGEIFTGDIVMTTPEKYEVKEGTESDVILKNIFIESRINLNVKGTIRNQKIELTANVELKQALQDLRRHIRHDLSNRLRQELFAYFDTYPQKQIFLCLDNLEKLQKTTRTQETADWLLNDLLPSIYLQNQKQFRVIITNLSASNWPEAILHSAIQQTLQPFSKPETIMYLTARGLKNKRLTENLFKVTQGHPLCLALAVDLYSLKPQLGSKYINQYVPVPFHSGYLAYNLFQAIIEYTPDEATKKILQYGPIFRVLDDEVIDNILAIELGLTKDRIKELIARLQEYSIFEDGEQIIFRPTLSQHTLSHLQQLDRGDPLSPLYRRLNRRAFIYYGRQAKEKNHARRKPSFVKMTYHEINLDPKQANQILHQRITEAVSREDHDLVSSLVDIMPEETISDLTINKSPPQEKARLSAHQIPKQQQQSNNKNTPPVIKPQSSNVSTTLFSELMSALGKYLIKKRVDIKNYVTSPLWRLRRHHLALANLHRRQKRYIRNIEKETKRVHRNGSKAQELQAYIQLKTLPYIGKVEMANQKLTQLAKDAQQIQQIHGKISERQFTEVNKQLNKQNQNIEKANQQLKRFYEQHNYFLQSLQQSNNAVDQNNQEIQIIYTSGANLQQEAQQIFGPHTSYKFTSVQEEEKGQELLTKIEKKYNQIIFNQTKVDTAGEAFHHSIPPAHQSVSNLNNALNDLSRMIDDINGRINETGMILSSLDGVEVWRES